MSLKVKVCIGTPCHLMGAQDLIFVLKDLNQELETKIEIEAVNCLEGCDQAPAVEINGEVYAPSNPQQLKDLIKKNYCLY